MVELEALVASREASAEGTLAPRSTMEAVEDPATKGEELTVCCCSHHLLYQGLNKTGTAHWMALWRE
jgi:hypothetical protein